MTEETGQRVQEERGLRRELRFWEAIALSIGIMAPGAAMAPNGAATAGSRMLFAPCRDGFLSRRLGETSARSGAPANALAAVMVVGIITFVILRIGGVSAMNAFFYPATVGVLTLLVAYIVANVGALRFLFASRRVPTWEAVFPVIGLEILIYVTYIAAAWLLVGLASVLLVPGLARRIGANLAAREGMAVEGEREPT